MSEQPHLPLLQEGLAEDTAVSSPEPSQEKALPDSLFHSYVDLDADSSGIFGNLDIETAKQIVRRMQP
jgi:hypothetical protein